jgi:hypothetical protein
MPAFREFDHTADLGIEVEAVDLPALFTAAGEALFALIADSPSIEERGGALSAVIGSLKGCHAWLCRLLAQFSKRRRPSAARFIQSQTSASME